MNELEALEKAFTEARAKVSALQNEGQKVVDLRRMSADELGRFEIRRAALPRLIEQAEIEKLRASYAYQDALYTFLAERVSTARAKCNALEIMAKDANRELEDERTRTGRLESQMLGARHERGRVRRQLEDLSAGQTLQPLQQSTVSSNTETSFNVRLPLTYS